MSVFHQGKVSRAGAFFFLPTISVLRGGLCSKKVEKRFLSIKNYGVEKRSSYRIGTRHLSFVAHSLRALCSRKRRHKKSRPGRDRILRGSGTR
nr:MAG TPA: hypothetical protein [Caudoviricetes sp.]